MNIEQQVCNLEQAKKLSEFGINPTSLFQWREYLDEGVNEWQSAILFEGKTEDDSIKYALADSSYPAFTVAELILMLPERTSVSRGHKNYSCRHWWGNFMDGILRNVKPNSWHETKGETAASALAEMLIYLLENNLTTAKEANERLSK